MRLCVIPDGKLVDMMPYHLPPRNQLSFRRDRLRGHSQHASGAQAAPRPPKTMARILRPSSTGYGLRQERSSPSMTIRPPGSEGSCTGASREKRLNRLATQVDERVASPSLAAVAVGRRAGIQNHRCSRQAGIQRSMSSIAGPPTADSRTRPEINVKRHICTENHIRLACLLRDVVARCSAKFQPEDSFRPVLCCWPSARGSEVRTRTAGNIP